MTKRTEQYEDLGTTIELEESEDLELENTDVGLLLDKDGNLKTVFGPAAGFENPSETLAAILKILGIAELVKPARTLH
jgi:phosphoglucomutase